MHVDHEEVLGRFEPRSMTEDQQARAARIRTAMKLTAAEVLKLAPASRSQALALTKLEEASMHAVAAIVREDG